MKLLIADDSAVMRKAISKYLEDYNFEIIGNAGDGEAAVKIFKEKKPEIVTLDITMPKLDGLQCLEQIMNEDSNAKVIIVSALTNPEYSLKALKMGAKTFVKKPFTRASLQQAFNKVLATKGDS